MPITMGVATRSSRVNSKDSPLSPGSARSFLLTVLGELVWPAGRPVWTSALLHILRGLGFEEQTARQAIARAAASGWIVSGRRGREVSWTLSTKLTRILETGSPRVYSLSEPFLDWTGEWLAVMITVPQSLRSARRPLYAGFSWAGLGNPAPGVWVSPHVERVDEVDNLLRDLGLKEHAIAFVGSVKAIGIDEAEIVRQGWDLDALREHYERVLEAISHLAPDGPDETLLAHIRMISEWQEMPRADPQLPEALLPDWIGRRVSRRIEALRAEWTPTVRASFAEINDCGRTS